MYKFCRVIIAVVVLYYRFLKIHVYKKKKKNSKEIVVEREEKAAKITVLKTLKEELLLTAFSKDKKNSFIKRKLKK